MVKQQRIQVHAFRREKDNTLRGCIRATFEFRYEF